jgi:hypothetical protein
MCTDFSLHSSSYLDFRIKYRNKTITLKNFSIFVIIIIFLKLKFEKSINFKLFLIKNEI